MGRQINFFMSENDEARFIEMVKSYQDYFIDVHGNHVSYEEIISNPSKLNADRKLPTSQLFIAAPNSYIEINGGILQRVISEVIEFDRSLFSNPNEIWNGRIWIATRYYDNNNVIVKKQKSFLDKFSSYRKWITKNLIPDKEKIFYIGPDAYSLMHEKKLKMKNSPTVEIEFP